MDTLSGLGQIALPVRDLDASISFYHKVLGLPALMQFPGMAFFDLAGVRLMIQAMDAPMPSSTVLYFQVDEIQGAYADLATRGVSFLDEPHMIVQLADHDLWMVFFQDPDEHPLALMAEVPTSC